MPLSRRRFLAAAAQAALCGPALARAEAPGRPPARAGVPGVAGLRQIAAARGLLYGSMIRGRLLAKERAYAELVARECSLFVCRELHWDDVEPRRFVDEFAQPDADAAWAAAHDMKFRGHALLWGEHVPEWFRALPDRAAGVRALSDHIARACRHFAGRIYAWDVVNEALKRASGRPDMLRKTAFLDLIGPEYLDIAFHTAREGDPKAQLVYNEFDLELDLPRHRDRRRALFDLLDGFKKRGTPIDTIGLQSHLSTELMAHFDEKVFADFLRELTGRGLDIMITELDVIDRGAPGDIAKRDAEVAQAYRRYLDAALANRAVKAVITWGLSDRDSWITNGHYPQTLRADGLTPRPLPFDVDYLPKPAYVAIAEALHAAPPR